MNKHARDNRANQLNPNNRAYWASRQGGNASRGGHGNSNNFDYTNHYAPKFVSAPPKRNLFGKKKSDDYGWVICNHVGKFLTNTTNPYWSDNFENAVVFDSEKAAQEQVKWFKKTISGQMPFFRVRCIKIV